MRPLPETERADELYGPFVRGDEDLVDGLVLVAERVRTVVPECVGMSLSLLEEGVTFTVVATSSEVAVLDAVQYVDGGPCADALAQQDVVVTTGPSTMEEQWELFGRAARAAGVGSTLSLPVLDDGRRVGGFNIYASEPHAFDGQVAAVAQALGTWAEDAVLDGDLGFSTRELARRAPVLLRDSTRLALAAGLLARATSLRVAEAEDRLRRAAVRAAVPLPLLVEEIITILTGSTDDEVG